jgi:hypothetical protein
MVHSIRRICVKVVEYVLNIQCRVSISPVSACTQPSGGARRFVVTHSSWCHLILPNRPRLTDRGCLQMQPATRTKKLTVVIHAPNSRPSSRNNRAKQSTLEFTALIEHPVPRLAWSDEAEGGRVRTRRTAPSLCLALAATHRSGGGVQ